MPDLRQVPGPAGTGMAGYPLDWAARHESGHAVVAWIAGLPFRRVVLSREGCGSMIEPEPGAWAGHGGTLEAKVLAKMLISAAGAIAEYQHRGLGLGDRQVVKLLQGRDREVICYHDAVTGLVTQTGHRAPAVTPGADLHVIARIVAGKPPTTCIAFWRGCERFVTGCAPAIDAVAAALLERRELSCAEVDRIATAAVQGHPAPAVPWAAP